MNPLTGLTDYLRRVERRVRVLAFTKGVARRPGVRVPPGRTN